MSAAQPSITKKPLAIDVVSVQSQVVYGRVGNNVAVPVLEGLGMTVAAVPTVMFSNRPSYPSNHGAAIPIDWFEGYLHDLDARQVLDGVRAIQLGYLGNADQARVLDAWLSALVERYPELMIVIDPVIGDQERGVYIADDVSRIYHSHLTQLATGLVPNGFELACLAGRSLDTLEVMIDTARGLLNARTQWVAVTTAEPSGVHDEMWVIVVTTTQAHVIRHPRLAVALSGTGDLFAAAMTGHWLNGEPLEQAAAQACAHVLAVLRQSAQAGTGEMVLTPHPPQLDMSEIHIDRVEPMAL